MGAGHAHGPSDLDLARAAFDAPMRRGLAVAAWVLAAVTLLGLVLLWPSDRPASDLTRAGVPDAYVGATVISIETFACPGASTAPHPDDPRPPDPTPDECATVTFRLDEGPDAGEQRSADLYDLGARPALRPGDRIVVPFLADADEPFRYGQQFERERGMPMLVLALVFAGLVVVQSRLRGLAALAGLVASIATIVVFVLPALLDGRSPVVVAAVAASAIAFLALYLAHGFSPLTTVALLGTLASLLLVTALSWLFTRATVLSGFDEETQYLRVLGGEFDLRGLLLAGMILGALGAIDDMTVTQASAVAELRVANPAYGFGELYRSGMRIGRDHVASTVNTLALAYAGASLPLLLLFVSSQQSLGRVLTSEVVATEVVRTLVGSIGLVASVPLTTALAARLVGGTDDAQVSPSG